MTRGAGKERLSRRHRLTGRGSFSAVLGSGRKFRGPHTVVHVKTGVSGQSRLGVAVGRKIAHRAVDRNRIKRLVREAFRRHPIKAKGLDVIVAFRPPAMDSSLWVAELATLFGRACEVS